MIRYVGLSNLLQGNGANNFYQKLVQIGEIDQQLLRGPFTLKGDSYMTPRLLGIWEASPLAQNWLPELFLLGPENHIQ